MAKQVIISLLVLTVIGQYHIHAQETTVPDSLKTRLETKEAIKSVPEFQPAPPLPSSNINSDLFSGSLPSPYLDTRGWGMQFSDPVLPWGLQGSSSYQNYIGLGMSRSATIQKDIRSGNFTFSAYSSVQKHAYDYMNATMVVAGGAVTFSINEHWSATAFGRYASNPGMMFSPAAQALIPSSNFGGYATYRVDNFSISGGVRQEFNPYTNRWETYPIVMPQVKIGDVKIGVDVGPILKEGVQQMNRKNQKPPPPPPPPSGRRR